MKILTAALVAGLAAQAPLIARDVPEAAFQAAGLVPLRVQLVLSRYQGDKKLSSAPYTLAVVANDKDRTVLRMGVDVPIPTGESAKYSYRSVGTNIDCTASGIEPGLYRLDLGVSETSIQTIDKAGAQVPTMSGVPALRSFSSTFNVLIRDGQTQQHTSATDPVTGEVLRVDVTVNVVK